MSLKDFLLLKGAMKEGMRQWKKTGKKVFPGVNRLGRKVVSDAKHQLEKVGKKIDSRANDVWLKNKGLSSEFRVAAGKKPSEPRVLDPTAMKESAAKKLALGQKASAARRANIVHQTTKKSRGV